MLHNRSSDARSHSDDRKSWFAHLFIVSLEVILLYIQYQRAEIFAFEVMPELADRQILFFYGSHMFGVLWVLIVIFISYMFWEFVIAIQMKGRNSVLFKGVTAFTGVVNLGVIYGEFLFFTKLITDGQATIDANLAHLIGIILVIAHQYASFWIMRYILDSFFFSKKPAEKEA